MELLIDTDPAMGNSGGDPEDGLALILALRSPEVQVKAVTVVFGNIPLAPAYSNAVNLLQVMGREDIPVAPGFARPLMPGREYRFPWAQEQFVAQLDPGSAPHHAVDVIVSTVLESTSGVTLVAIGPLTNIAAAIQREPRIVERAARLVIMGGAARVPGNITPCAEFNIWSDPEAAAIVFNSGLRIKMVGLDACNQTRLDPARTEALGTASPLAKLVHDSVAPWRELRRREFGGEPIRLYDSLALAATIKPELVRTEPCWVDVETKGTLTSGQTVAYLDPITKQWVGDKVNCDVWLGLDTAGFEALFTERVLEPLSGTSTCI